MSSEAVRKAIADYAWSQGWRRDRRRLEEAIRGTPESPACHVPECPYLAATCHAHRDAEVALARVRALIDSSWPIPREAMGAFFIPTPMFDSAQRNALRTALAYPDPVADPICAECSSITGVQQECDYLCSGSS